MTSRFSLRVTVQVAYTSRPPRREQPPCGLQQAAPAAAGNLSISDGDLRSRISGWRRITPSAEHGASSRIRSNGMPSHQAAGQRASPATMSACKPPRSRFSRTRARRCGSMSTASQLRKMRLAFRDQRGFAARRRAGIEHPLTRGQAPAETPRTARPDPAPRPCPRANPGSSCTSQGVSKTTA